MNGVDDKHQAILAYWIRDYVRFLERETGFDPKKLIRYKRGCIVKAHLGYRIGSEEGGLHYAVVVDVSNAQSSQTVTIIPLTSVKAHTDIEHLHRSKVYLGSEIYQRLTEKANGMRNHLLGELTNLSDERESLWKSAPDETSPEYSIWEENNQSAMDSISARVQALSDDLTALQRIRREISKMKAGSIALVGQITTISKIRIYDPLYPADTLTNIRLSPESLDKLDNKIKGLFTNPK